LNAAAGGEVDLAITIDKARATHAAALSAIADTAAKVTGVYLQTGAAIRFARSLPPRGI
jgi:hypothetical protein